MPDSQDPTLTLRSCPVPCALCGHYVAPGTIRCPKCGILLEAFAEQSTTTELVRRPRAYSELNPPSELLSNTRVVLQFFPSAHCITLDLDDPVVLGRGALPGSESVVDLTDYDARQHGVSRRHCLLKRDDTRLLAVDLGSTNGTYLNGARLDPKQAVVVSSGDRLILGTLHMLITFHRRAGHG